jgi:dihydrofolate reductase
MARLIAAINLTIDGFCDHTAVTAGDELLRHYSELLSQAGAILYGRITYQLMESYWPAVAMNPAGNKPEDEFAEVIQHIPKIVFSRTLTSVGWENARLAKGGLEEEVIRLMQQPDRDILAGSRSLIAALTELNLIDEYQLCVHPVIAGGGLPLFKDVKNRATFKLLKTKTFGSGAIVLYYEPAKK